MATAKELGNMGAFPLAGWADGFTRRELFAAMAMQGLASMEYHKWENLAQDAVNLADALLTALEESSHV